MSLIKTKLRYLIYICCIIGVAFFVIPTHTSYPISKGQITKNYLIEIKVAVDMYKLEYRAYPAQHRGLKALYDSDIKFLQINEHPVDGWGTPYRYEISRDALRFKVYSAGKDGIFNTKDDIYSK